LKLSIFGRKEDAVWGSEDTYGAFDAVAVEVKESYADYKINPLISGLLTSIGKTSREA